MLKGTPRNATLVSNSPNTVALVLSGDQIQSSLEAFPASYEAIVLACDARVRKASERASTTGGYSSSVGSIVNVVSDPQANPTVLMLPNLIGPDKKEPPRILGNLFFTSKPIQQSDSNASSLEIFADQHRSFSGEISAESSPGKISLFFF